MPASTVISAACTGAWARIPNAAMNVSVRTLVGGLMTFSQCFSLSHEIRDGWRRTFIFHTGRVREGHRARRSEMVEANQITRHQSRVSVTNNIWTVSKRDRPSFLFIDTSETRGTIRPVNSTHCTYSSLICLP